MKDIESRVGTIVGGKYRLHEPIASSTSGVVYRAEHLDLEVDVAVQVLVRTGDDEWNRAFRREVRVLSKLRHPNIVELQDFGQIDDGRPYLVLEYVRGTTLFRLLEEGKRLEPEATAELGRTLAGALRYAHQFGVFHLSLTPSKVLFDMGFGGRVPKIVDFLAARWPSIDASAASVPDFRVAPPELLRGETPTAASDVYVLGHLLYACLYGELALASVDEEAGRAASLSPHPWSLPANTEVPVELRRLVERCLEKSPEKRWVDCAVLVDALDTFLQGEADTVKVATVVRPARQGYFPNPGEVFAGKFEVDAVIGAGGFARVYRATSLGTRRPVALKILRPDRKADSTEALRFIREGKLVFSMLSNPHTISVFDYGEAEGGLLYIAFEYIDGETLDAVVAREGRLPADRVARILEMCLGSLAEAHGLGVLHRDIKPSNIMLSKRGGVFDWVTVLDFGVAKITSDVVDETELTSTGSTIGTPRYMSPEQISGESLGPESDLYSLGLVAYELLTSQKAIRGDNTIEIVGNQIDPQSVILPTDVGVPAPLALIVNKLMRKDRKMRYGSAREVLVELRNLDRAVDGTTTVDTGARSG